MALAAIALAVGATATVYWAQARTISHQRVQLQAQAQLALARVHAALTQVTLTLQALTDAPDEPCSAVGLARMRALTINTPIIEDIGFFEGQRLRCASWGPSHTSVFQQGQAIALGQGWLLYPNVRPLVAGQNPFWAFRLGAYSVLINPNRLLAKLPGTGIRLVLEGPTGTGRITAADGPWNLPAAQLTQVSSIESGWQVTAQQPRPRRWQALKAQSWMVLGALLGGGVILSLLTACLRRQLTPEAELRHAIDTGALVACYQPLMEVATGRCVGAEVLVRWVQPDGSMVFPDQFIALAERSGMAQQITLQMIELALRDLSTTLIEDRSFHLAINLSADDVMNGHFLSPLTAALGQDVAPSQIWLEVTESALIDMAKARQVLGQARQRGLRVALDDFGTGYSNLQYLQQLPADVVKIDKSFIQPLGDPQADITVLLHVVALAAELGLLAIAEGVETRDQAERLSELGVMQAQGWYYAPAMPCRAFLDFYHTHRLSD